jgi:hypothetical protein
MDSTHTDTADLIANYLAGRLPANRVDAFEQDVSRDPKIRNELEQTLKLKEGLALLRERGELRALLQAAPRRRWPLYAAAASAAFVSLVVALWLQLRTTEPSVLLPSVSGLAQSHAPLAATYTLARMRGAASSTETTLTAPAGLIRLRVVPSADAMDRTGYTVSLQRVDTQPTHLVGTIDAGSVGADGYLTVFLDRSRLAAGTYELSVMATVPNASSAVSDRFVLRVQ